jgi:prefoldin beta subunit
VKKGKEIMTINLDDLDEEQKNKIQNLANLQQTYEIIETQRRQTESHQRETEFAIEELEKVTSEDTTVYKSLGGILVLSDKNKLLDEKKSLKVTLEMRLKTLDQKKSRLENQIKTLTSSIQSDLQNKDA